MIAAAAAEVLPACTFPASLNSPANAPTHPPIHPQVCHLDCSGAAAGLNATQQAWLRPPYRVVSALSSQKPLGERTMSVLACHYDGAVQYNTHNLFGLSECLATHDAVRAATGRRPFVLSRSTFLGAGAFAGHWTGDNSASWEQLQWSIPGTLSTGLWGIPFAGADVSRRLLLLLAVPLPPCCPRHLPAAAAPTCACLHLLFSSSAAADLRLPGHHHARALLPLGVGGRLPALCSRPRRLSLALPRAVPLVSACVLQCTVMYCSAPPAGVFGCCCSEHATRAATRPALFPTPPSPQARDHRGGEASAGHAVSEGLCSAPLLPAASYCDPPVLTPVAAPLVPPPSLPFPCSYSLLPYLYSAFHRAHRTGAPVARPLWAHFPADPAARTIDRQFMVGDALLVSPVLEQGASSVDAYFPPGAWHSLWDGGEAVDAGCAAAAAAALHSGLH